MKKLICIFLFINVFATQVSFGQTTRPTSFDQRDACEENKGAWRQFGNGCVDSCRSKMDKFMICSMAITYGCDCGKGRCWEENRCVDAKEYKVAFEEQKELEQEYLDIQKEKRRSDFEANRRIIAGKLISINMENGTKPVQKNMPKKNIFSNNTASKPQKTQSTQVNQSDHLSPLAAFIAKNMESEKKNDEPAKSLNDSVKQKFEIPSFFVKKQEAEKKIQEAEKKLSEELSETNNTNSNITVTPPKESGIEKLPDIPLPN